MLASPPFAHAAPILAPCPFVDRGEPSPCGPCQLAVAASRLVPHRPPPAGSSPRPGSRIANAYRGAVPSCDARACRVPSRARDATSVCAVSAASSRPHPRRAQGTAEPPGRPSLRVANRGGLEHPSPSATGAGRDECGHVCVDRSARLKNEPAHGTSSCRIRLVDSPERRNSSPTQLRTQRPSVLGRCSISVLHVHAERGRGQRSRPRLPGDRLPAQARSVEIADRRAASGAHRRAPLAAPLSAVT